MMVQKLSKIKSKKDNNVLTINKGKLTVTNFQTADPEIVEYFEKQRPELREDRFVSAIRTGVMALKSTEISERVDYVEKKFEKLNNKFEDALEESFEELESLQENYFGEKGTLDEIISKYFGEDGTIFKEIFDPNREGSPLYKLNYEMKNEISQLRQQLGIQEKEDEMKNKTTLKGVDFEDQCQDILEGSAKVFGDIVENTTSKAGKLKRSKKGDLVLTIADSSKKITFEIKDVASISANEIQKTLDEAIENRGASCGILVAKYVEAFPKSIGWFQEIGKNKLVIALGSEDEESFHDMLLLIAYKWARTKVNSQSLEEKKVDAELIANKIESIKQKIQRLSTIKTDCKNIEKTTKNIRTNSETLAEEIGEELDEMNKSLVHENILGDDKV